MLILLPPSETKTTPRAGLPLAVGDRPRPLRTPTEHVLRALVALCRRSPTEAAGTLGITPGQLELVSLDAALGEAPCAPAWQVYSGVLFDALGVPGLSPGAKQRALQSTWVASALFGVVRLDERIPAYRLSAGTTLPGLSPLTSIWRHPIDETIRSVLGADELVLDLRSGPYLALWPIPTDLLERTVLCKVWQRHPDGSRSAVSHFNKATKGRIAADLLRSRRTMSAPTQLRAALAGKGWDVQLQPPGRSAPWRLDVTID